MMFASRVLLAGLLAAPGAALADSTTIPIGQLSDYSGPTSDIGFAYGGGVTDAIAWINARGGVNGRPIASDQVDYSYKADRAIAAYKKWMSQTRPAIAVQGWGTADTEALVGSAAKDQVVFYSGSYAGHLTDPTGSAMRGDKRAAPYNFFYGPSYSDAARALLQWAASDWKQKAAQGTPKYVHMGANHPYPNAPRAAAEEYAKELGFEVIPAIQYPLAPGDYTAQCLTLKEAGANYAYLGNTSGSNISVIRSCATAGVKVQFLSNVWGMDENAMKAAGTAADGVVFPVRTGATWSDNEVSGMEIVHAISRMSDKDGTAYRAVHYLAGICSAFYMKEAMQAASKTGEPSGPTIKAAMEARKDWVPAGLEGVCQPSTWTAQDHRGTTKVAIYRAKVSGSTDAPVGELMSNGHMKLEKVAEFQMPRRAEWLGW
jgi:branched-chain amino acid transport system substrate-binding protein